MKAFRICRWKFYLRLSQEITTLLAYHRRNQSLLAVATFAKCRITSSTCLHSTLCRRTTSIFLEVRAKEVRISYSLTGLEL